jgi:hypothetical protein
VQGNNVQSDDVQDDGVQRIAVSPLDELRPRPSWCTGRSHAVREVLQRDDSGRTRPGGSRVARDGRRRPLRRKQWTRSGGTANYSWRIWRWPGASRPWPSRRQRGQVWRGEAKAKVRAELNWRIRKCGAEAFYRRRW